ncbi:hypothetical protein [Streptomyces atratus]|uniref:hypothetical protein n=1 Tax=Streptomyces atratus TaxID=1893 RepID=UPI00365FC4B3
MDAEVPKFLSYACTSVATERLASGTWCLGRHLAPTPQDAVRWLVGHIEAHELNAEIEAAAVASWWLNNPEAQDRTVERLAAGELVFMRFPSPAVDYLVRIRPRYRSDLRSPIVAGKGSRDQ